MSAAAFAAVAAPLAGLAGLGAWTLAAERRTRRLLGQRIAAVRPASGIAARAPTATLTLSAVLGPVFDPLLGINRAHASDETLAIPPWLALGAIAGAALFVVLTKLFALGPMLALAAAAAAGLSAARMGIASRRGTILGTMEDAFAQALGVIIRCVRAGLPVTEGLRAVATEMPAPTGSEFGRAIDQIGVGEDFDTALVKLADRCALPDYRFFATAVALQRQTGGNLAETLDNLAETVRRRRAIKMKAAALTSEAKATVAVLAVLPAGVAAVLLFVNPAYILELVTTKDGKALLGLAIAIQATGLLVIRAILRRSLG